MSNASSDMSGTTANEDPINTTADPFAAQRAADDSPFANEQEGDSVVPPTSARDRRMSKEWGA